MTILGTVSYAYFTATVEMKPVQAVSSNTNSSSKSVRPNNPSTVSNSVPTINPFTNPMVTGDHSDNNNTQV